MWLFLLPRSRICLPTGMMLGAMLQQWDLPWKKALGKALSLSFPKSCSYPMGQEASAQRAVGRRPAKTQGAASASRQEAERAERLLVVWVWHSCCNKPRCFPGEEGIIPNKQGFLRHFVLLIVHPRGISMGCNCTSPETQGSGTPGASCSALGLSRKAAAGGSLATNPNTVGSQQLTPRAQHP